MNQSGESCGADARAIEVVVLDARERHVASGKTLRADIDPSLVLDDVSRTLDALVHLVDFAFASAPPESEIDLVVTKPAHRLVRVGAVRLSLRWQVRADSRGDADEGKIVSIRAGVQAAYSLQQSSAAHEIEALFEAMSWRVSIEAVAATGEIWARAACD